MPFKSDKQRKWMHANEPEMAKKWEKEESINEMPNFDRGTSGLPRGFVDDYNKIIKKLSKGKGYATLSKSDKKKVWATLGKIYNESINESNIIKKIDKLAKANKYGTVDGTRMNGKTAREIMAVFMHPKMNSHRRQMVSMKSHELVDLTISLLKPLKIKVESINEAKGYKVTNSELSHMVTYLSDWSKEFDGNMSMGKNLHGKPAQPYYHNRLKKNVSGGKEDALKALIKDWKKYDVSPAMTTKIFKTYHKLSTSKQKFGNPDFWENFLEKQGISVVYESINEGKWSKIMRSVRKGSKSGPWTIVVYKGKKVLHQRTVKILQQIPAHYEDVLNLKDLAPGIKIGIEDKYGERVYTESINEKISKEEWAQYPKYARKLKPYMQRLFKVPLRVKVIKQANANPWIDISVVRFGKDIIPNDFRKKALKVIGGSNARDMDNINYGNIRSNSVSLKHNQWVKLLGNKIKESINKAKRGTDLYFVIDQLVNSMEHYDEREFIKHIGKETKYSSPQLKKLYKSYYKLSPRKRFSMSFNWEKWLKNQGISEASERDYKAEYNKFQSSTKSKKYRAELNQYNRKKGTYGNNDGKDASHKGGKIVGFEKESTNRGRREKSRLKKEAILKLRQMIREELGLGDYND